MDNATRTVRAISSSDHATTRADYLRSQGRAHNDCGVVAALARGEQGCGFQHCSTCGRNSERARASYGRGRRR